MTCPTCRREEMPPTCGSHEGKPCVCCGMIIVARHNPEPEEARQDVSTGTNDTSEE